MLPGTRDAAIERKDEALDFKYDWPGPAAAIGPLDAWLRSHADTQYKKAHADADNGRTMARKDGYPFRQYSFAQSWDSVADLPGVLVLESSGYSYTGGAHGMPFTTSLIWDRKAGKRLATKDLVDTARLTASARDAFCAELNRQREEKRGEKVDPDAKDGIAEFNQCPVMAEQEVIPMSRGKRALDTLRVVIGPYVAGPYVEGSYKIDLPMTPAMIAAINPAYRGWFSTGTP
ncbi:MAG: hypothetical protein B7Z20_04895 [Sphingobium sp. 32-64-5]|nr:MAG: hypothetical protein B7Z20_04895 [Sphingobium sp. 32-64-5]